MKKCKHDPGSAIRVFNYTLLGLPITLRCGDCGGWLSLGESDEHASEAVEIELDAAARAAAMAERPGPDRFDWCPSCPGGDQLCRLCEELFLAREIYEHEDGEP